jgi:ArsR family transcriptional regulator
VVEFFKALAEESRLRILALLLRGEMCVCEIEECLNMTQSNASRHLTALKNCGILESFKKAQWVYYRIDSRFMEQNPDLFAYLQKELENLPHYNTDSEKLSRCKSENLCD